LPGQTRRDLAAYSGPSARRLSWREQLQDVHCVASEKRRPRFCHIDRRIIRARVLCGKATSTTPNAGAARIIGFGQCGGNRTPASATGLASTCPGPRLGQHANRYAHRSVRAALDSSDHPPGTRADDIAFGGEGSTCTGTTPNGVCRSQRKDRRAACAARRSCRKRPGTALYRGSRYATANRSTRDQDWRRGAAAGTLERTAREKGQ